jgi:hypothetical protein
MLYALFPVWVKFCRFLAKILVPEGSKDVPVGQPIAITVTCDNHLSMASFCFHGKLSTVDFIVGKYFILYRYCKTCTYIYILKNILGNL